MAQRHATNEETELWREYRRAQQQRRADRLPPRTAEILALRGKGFHVEALTDYQFRVDGALDLFPIHRRFHDLKRQQRGGYQNVLDIAIRRLRQRPKQQEASMETDEKAPAAEDSTSASGTHDASSQADGHAESGEPATEAKDETEPGTPPA